MFEFLLGYCLGSSERNETEYPRYFRKPKPRELTKEEKRKRTISIIIIWGIVMSALFIYQDVLCRMSQIVHVLP